MLLNKTFLQFKKRKDNKMKITMYGAAICPDCVEAKAILEKHKDVELDYKNITESTKTLKEFLSYRDNDKMFTNVVKRAKSVFRFLF
ncbi:Glutaredoxin-like protein [human gut metagenome]|uniref:Glutaredoxin-like protein n=2 Tax=root TaxID=1 RepID=W1Y661_9ZZZZ